MEGTTSESLNGAGREVSTIQSLSGLLVISQDTILNKKTSMLDDEDLKRLCDLVFVVDDKECHALRAVLASASPVFRKMFTNGMKESNPSSYPQRIPLPEESYNCWQNVLEFVHSGKVDFRGGKSVIDLLECAHKYQFEDLVISISKFLRAQITTENALELYNYSVDYKLKDLEEACFACLEEGFEEAHIELNYELCPKRLMSRLLKSEGIEVVSELVMLNAALSWMKSHIEESRDEACSMLQWVRMDRMCLSELIEAGAVLAKHEASSAVTNRLMQAMLVSRSSDTLACVSMHNNSFLMRCKRYERPFTLVQKISGIVGIGSAKGFRASDQSDHRSEVKLEGRWIDDPTKRCALRLGLAVNNFNSLGIYKISFEISIKPKKNLPLTAETFVTQDYIATSLSKTNVYALARLYCVDINGKVGEISSRAKLPFLKARKSATPEFTYQSHLELSYIHLPEFRFFDSESDSIIIGANIVLPDKLEQETRFLW